MPLIAIVLVVVALAGGYVAFFRNSSAQSETPASIVETATSELPPTSTATSAETIAPVEIAASDSITKPPVEELVASETPKSVTLTSETITYRTPARNDNQVTLTLTLTNNSVTDVALNLNNGAGPHSNYQKRFESEYRTEVLGKSVDDISLSRVGGASLTSKAFNDAIATIAR